MIKARKFLNEKKNLLIVTADKSDKTVIIENTVYRNKMLELLSNSKVYRKIGKCLKFTLQNKNNALVKKWFQNNWIGKSTTQSLTNLNAIPCRIYGLVKTHKPGMPLRPIVSSINSPFYNMSKYFGNILEKVVGKTGHTVKNSYEFIEFLKSQILPDDFVLSSFDVESMYTNIPIKLALNVITEK